MQNEPVIHVYPILEHHKYMMYAYSVQLMHTSGYGIQVAMEYKWLWNTSGYGIQVAMEYKWLWNTSGYGMQVAMEYKWLWNTSGNRM